MQKTLSQQQREWFERIQIARAVKIARRIVERENLYGVKRYSKDRKDQRRSDERKRESERQRKARQRMAEDKEAHADRLAKQREYDRANSNARREKRMGMVRAHPDRSRRQDRAQNCRARKPPPLREKITCFILTLLTATKALNAIALPKNQIY